MGFSLPVQFRKAIHTLPTPPTSPQDPQKALKRQASRFRLPKLLRRSQPENLITTEPTKAICQIKSSSSEVTYRAEKDERDFPSFRLPHEMERPLRPLVPAIPTLATGDGPLTGTLSRTLRKMPRSYHNLRVCNYENQFSSEPPKLPGNIPALLPSPLPSDREENQGGGTCFTFGNPVTREARHDTPTEVSYEYQNIVAAYCEDDFNEDVLACENTVVPAAERSRSPSTPVRQQDMHDWSAAARTPPTSNMSAILRSPKRDRSNSLSSEATWLSKSFAHEDHSPCMGQLERIKMNENSLAEKSRRCCHLVQGPTDDLLASWTGERKASYATVIKPGKANDIWVPRPASSSLKSRCSSRTNAGQEIDLPRTPERKLFEVSAFSPWDSPAERRVSGRLDRVREGHLRNVATCGNLRYSFEEYSPSRKPFFPIRKSSLRPLHTLSPTSLSSASSTSTLISDCSHSNNLAQSSGSAHHISSTEQAAWSKCAELARLLEDLTQSIDNYPTQPLHLDSPSILRLRASHSLDELHIDHLGKIFPDRPRHDLSALAALLIAQSHLANLNPPNMSDPEPGPWRGSSSTYYSRLAAQSNECLNHIPDRTIKTLGIRLENITSVEERERALRKRAQVVELALHVLVQQVMGRVCGRYDETLWRALRCLAETLEAGW